MAIFHRTDPADPQQDPPGPDSAPAAEPAPPKAPPRQDGVRRLVVFVGRHRPEPA